MQFLNSMDELVFDLLKRDAYRKGEYTLSSGKKSEHYVNCKPVILNGRGLFMTSCLLLDHVEEDSVAVAGLTLGADPLVSGVAISAALDGRKLNALIIRKEPKGHGTASQIEGPLPPKGSKITVLEDVVTSGASCIKAVKVLRDQGYEVNRVISIIDRQERDKFVFFDAQLELVSLFTLADLAK